MFIINKREIIVLVVTVILANYDSTFSISSFSSTESFLLNSLLHADRCSPAVLELHKLLLVLRRLLEGEG